MTERFAIIRLNFDNLDLLLFVYIICFYIVLQFYCFETLRLFSHNNKLAI